jgi:hypothetical protein
MVHGLLQQEEEEEEVIVEDNNKYNVPRAAYQHSIDERRTETSWPNNNSQ